MRGREANEVIIEEDWKNLLASMKKLEQVWLPNNSTKKYMFGDQPTIADLSLAMELIQLEGIDFHNKILKPKYPGVYKWLYTNMMEV